jgi:hypothetical protein
MRRAMERISPTSNVTAIGRVAWRWRAGSRSAR